MHVVFRLGSVLFVAVAAFLIYAVVSAVGSAGGARVDVCIRDVISALVLGYIAVSLWRTSAPGTA